MDSTKQIPVSLHLTYASPIVGTWEVNDTEKRASWELYVELVTRISVIELKPDEGVLREALSSLYTLFDSTRGVLKKYGPEVGQSSNGHLLSFGYLSVTMLNSVLRPVLAKWHPLLLDHEIQKKPHVSIVEHEKQWSRYKELRDVLQDVSNQLSQYGDLFGQASDTLFHERKQQEEGE